MDELWDLDPFWSVVALLCLVSMVVLAGVAHLARDRRQSDWHNALFVALLFVVFAAFAIAPPGRYGYTTPMEQFRDMQARIKRGH